MITEPPTRVRHLIPGWGRVPPTPDELRPAWDAARETLAGQVARLNHRAFVAPAELLALQEMPSVAVIGIVPSAEFFYGAQAGNVVMAALAEAIGRPVDLRAEVFRATEAPDEPRAPIPATPGESALARRRPGAYRQQRAQITAGREMVSDDDASE